MLSPDSRTDSQSTFASPMLSCTFVSRNSRHSFNMRLPERLYGRVSVGDDGSPRDSHELPRFSFEEAGRPLVSTERLFNEWSQDEETAYNPGFNAIESALKLEQDIIVSEPLHVSVQTADAYCRSPGMARMILRTLSTGRSHASGSSQCLVSLHTTVSFFCGSAR